MWLWLLYSPLKCDISIKLYDHYFIYYVYMKIIDGWMNLWRDVNNNNNNTFNNIQQQQSLTESD